MDDITSTKTDTKERKWREMSKQYTKDEVGGGAMHTASIFLHLCLRLVLVTSSLYVYTLCVGFGTRF